MICWCIIQLYTPLEWTRHSLEPQPTPFDTHTVLPSKQLSPIHEAYQYLSRSEGDTGRRGEGGHSAQLPSQPGCLYKSCWKLSITVISGWLSTNRQKLAWRPSKATFCWFVKSACLFYYRRIWILNLITLVCWDKPRMWCCIEDLECGVISKIHQGELDMHWRYSKDTMMQLFPYCENNIKAERSSRTSARPSTMPCSTSPNIRTCARQTRSHPSVEGEGLSRFV